MVRRVAPRRCDEAALPLSKGTGVPLGTHGHAGPCRTTRGLPARRRQPRLSNWVGAKPSLGRSGSSSGSSSGVTLSPVSGRGSWCTTR